MQRDLEAAVFEQRAERGRRQALAQRTHHAAGYKYKFHLNINRRDVESRMKHHLKIALFAFIRGYHVLKIFSTRATSSGTSTPTLS